MDTSREINRLIGEFMDLQERWERDRDALDWSALEALAQKSATAYNEGVGPSLHSLTFDGVQHDEFHERFLGYLLQAGFDPFRLVSAGSGSMPLPVISHADLAEAAEINPSSARMRDSLLELARARFEPLAREVASGEPATASPLFAVVMGCAESIPDDLMQRISPALVKQRSRAKERKAVNPEEGFLSIAEVEVEQSHRPIG